MACRYECLPRKIKRATTQNEDTPESKNEQTYQFYRNIIHPLILKLNNEKDKLNYALWLNRLDKEAKEERRIHFIKIIFISLKRNQSFNIFLYPPPEDLNELNMVTDNTVEMIEYLQNNTEDIALNDENILQKTKFKRFAAVSADMNSYTTVKISKYLVQSFYVMSDFPINIWNNPTNIVTPNNLDHNQWELFLNNFKIMSQDKIVSKHKNNCEDIMKLDQVIKEGPNNFVWHPHSVLKDCNRPKRSAGFKEIDQDILNQRPTQQQMDEAAFAIVHNKTFPGYKMLNPRIYSTIIMPDPEFVFNTTGVKITYNKIHPSLSKNDKQNPLKIQNEKIPKTCNPIKRQNSVNDDEKKSICTKQLPCSNITQNTNNCQKSFINTTKQTQMPRVKAGNGSELKLNKTYMCSIPHENGNSSFSLNLLNKSLDSTNKRMKCKPNNSSSCNKETKNYNQTSNNQSKVSNDQCPYNSSLNNSSNYNWTMSSNEISMDQNSVPIYTSIPKNSNCHSNRSHSESRNNQLSYIESTNQNSRKNCNHNGRYHTNREHDEERPQHNKTNISSNLDQSQYEGYINVNTNQNHRSNNASRHQNTRSRSVSVPGNSNRVHKNFDAKREKPQNENQNNNSCPAYVESRKNKTCNISNCNVNKSVTPKLECKRNDTMCCPRYYDKWDIDVGNYTEFESYLTSERQNQLSCKSSLNSRPNIQSSFSEPYDSANSSDWSDEISMKHLPNEYNSCNSFDSFSTLTTSGSNSDDHQNCIDFNNRFNEAMSTDFESDDFTNEGSLYPFNNTQQPNNPNFNLQTSTNCRDEINYNNKFSDSVSMISEEHDFMNPEISCQYDNAQQSVFRPDYLINSDQDYQNLEDFHLSYINIHDDSSVSDESLRNDIEDTGSPPVFYQQRCLQDWSFHEPNIRNISMPELSYDTTFSDYNESMDPNDDRNNC